MRWPTTFVAISRVTGSCPAIDSPYRARRFVRRHRVETVAAVGITISLLVGAGLSLWEARRAPLNEIWPRWRRANRTPSLRS
jgi:hypothetical protein